MLRDHEEITAWEGLAVALVVRLRAASLLFVAVSLNMEQILRIRTLPVVLARV